MSVRGHAPLVILIAAVAGCGGGGGGGSTSTSGGDRTGQALVYRADLLPREANPHGALARTANVISRRMRALHVDGSVRATGGDRIVLRLAPSRRGDLGLLTAPGRLVFLDWEASVLGPELKPSPLDPYVGGGPEAGRAGGYPLYVAVLLAARRPPVNRATSTTGDRYYLVDDARKAVLQGPVAARSELTPPSPGQRIVRVGAGTVIVRREKTSTGPATRFYVVDDNPALSGADLTDVKQAVDRVPGAGGSPIVTFNFTATGRAAWQTLTRAIARRGREVQVPGQPTLSFRHFAIALDDVLLTVPAIDFQQNPDGIDGSSGAEIAGGFTTRSARDLATLLRIGPLPVVRLVPA